MRTETGGQISEAGELAQQVGQALGVLISEVMELSARDMLCLLQREDLSMPRVTALMLLSRRGAASISEVSQHLNLSLPATSQLVDKLVESGLVTRAEDPGDRRQKHVSLTDGGRRCAAEVRRVRTEELTRRLAGLPAPLLESALAVLTTMGAQLRAGAGEAQLRAGAELAPQK